MIKRIGIDVRMVRHTGIGTYLQGLLHGFKSVEFPSDWKVSLFGDPEALRVMSFVHGSVQPFRSKIYSISEQFSYALPLLWANLWHAPHYNIPYFKKNTKLIVTVHDLIHWIYRRDFFSPAQAFYAGTMFRRVVETADHIIAVSKNTAKDLQTHFGADPQKISVVYESVGKDYRRIPDLEQIYELRNKYRLPAKYFLYVGSLKPHKNVQTLLRAYRSLRRQNKIESGLVIVGRKDKKYAGELYDLKTLQTGDGVWYLPDVDRQTLILLYNAALALVHPSLYEGFGLTPLESMACETPVIASNTSSIPEIVGDAALLFDPLDEKQIMAALQRMEQDPALAENLRVKGLERLKQFSWETTACQTFDIYKRVLES
jgi:glycosyltransferase involved in cell wall biosynthesis